MVSALLGQLHVFRVCTLTMENFLFLWEPVPARGLLTVPSVSGALCPSEPSKSPALSSHPGHSGSRSVAHAPHSRPAPFAFLFHARRCSVRAVCASVPWPCSHLRRLPGRACSGRSSGLLRGSRASVCRSAFPSSRPLWLGTAASLGRRQCQPSGDSPPQRC